MLSGSPIRLTMAGPVCDDRHMVTGDTPVHYLAASVNTPNIGAQFLLGIIVGMLLVIWIKR